MLWHKGWLESRFRFLFGLAGGIYLVGNAALSTAGSEAQQVVLVVRIATIAVAVLSAFLSGTGISTQYGLRRMRALHGSTMFTLTLPVSRFELLVRRTVLGLGELALAVAVVCGEVWLLTPALRANGIQHFGAQAMTLAGCGVALYFI